MIEQVFTGRRQLDAAPAARQQRNAERVLQSLDPLTPRGQREMNPLRAVGDAARLGHRDEELKIDQIETHPHLSTLMVRRRDCAVSNHEARISPAAILRDARPARSSG